MDTRSITRRQVRQRGDVIRELRRRDGRKASVFAIACGFAKGGTVTNIENETQQASWEALHSIARELAVPVAMILRDPESVRPAAKDDAA